MKSEHVSITGRDPLQHMESDRSGDLHIELDERTGLRTIVPIHGSRLGRASCVRCARHVFFTVPPCYGTHSLPDSITAMPAVDPDTGT